MLRIIEFSLLAVSLLVVVGLIVSGSRNSSESSATEPPPLREDAHPVQEPGKAR
ncbi:MAG: hypothetical protein WA634_16825 [Silvibacterium sp.]